jgi:hypothetical protein
LVTGQLEDTKKSECFYMGTQIATAKHETGGVNVSMMFNNVIQVSTGGRYVVNFDLKHMIAEAVGLIKKAEKDEVK